MTHLNAGNRKIWFGFQERRVIASLARGLQSTSLYLVGLTYSDENTPEEKGNKQP